MLRFTDNVQLSFYSTSRSLSGGGWGAEPNNEISTTPQRRANSLIFLRGIRNFFFFWLSFMKIIALPKSLHRHAEDTIPPACISLPILKSQRG